MAQWYGAIKLWICQLIEWHCKAEFSELEHVTHVKRRTICTSNTLYIQFSLFLCLYIWHIWAGADFETAIVVWSHQGWFNTTANLFLNELPHKHNSLLFVYSAAKQRQVIKMPDIHIVFFITDKRQHIFLVEH